MSNLDSSNANNADNNSNAANNSDNADNSDIKSMILAVNTLIDDNKKTRDLIHLTSGALPKPELKKSKSGELIISPVKNYKTNKYYLRRRVYTTDDINNQKTSLSLEPYYLYDNIYGKIDISMCSKIITEHRVFARLKDIKQLGTLHFKFGYAHHSRYVHSIGVAYLARYAGQALQRHHVEISDRMILCLELAALCHDLGHGPYSHSFDHLLYDLKVTDKTAAHESRSQMLFKFVAEDLQKKGHIEMDLTAEEIKLVQYFIDPKNYKLYFSNVKYSTEEAKDCSVYPTDVAPFFHGLEQIVNNPVHKVDVDKMDYLARDAQALRFDQTLRENMDIIGVLTRAMIVTVEKKTTSNLNVTTTSSLDVTTTRGESKKSYENIWMFNIRDQGVIYDLICRRFLFYTNSYLHPEVNAVNCMFTDALKQANKFWGFTECSLLRTDEDVNSYCMLTDNYILEKIMNSSDVRVRQSMELINRITEKKNWYRHIGDFVTSINDLDDSSYCELPWNIFTDKSTPTNLLPKVRYHQNGKPIDPNTVKYVRRLYIKDN